MFSYSTVRRSAVALVVGLVAVLVGGAAPASAAFGFVTQWGTTGSGPGQFQSPTGVATDAAGNVYVLDDQLASIQKFTPDGRLLATIGAPKGATCGTTYKIPPPGTLCLPHGIAVHSDGGDTSVYVTEPYVNRVQEFDGDDGDFVRTWGLSSCQGISPLPAGFCRPGAVTTDSKGGVYVADATPLIQAFDSTGDPTQSRNGPLCSIGCNNVGGLAWGGGSVYVADLNWSLVARITDANPPCPCIALNDFGLWGGGGSPATAQFSQNEAAPSPAGLAVAPGGEVLAADTGNDRVQRFTSGGQFLSAFGSSGQAPSQFAQPTGIATDSAGNVYVADTGNDRIQKFGDVASPIAPPAGGGGASNSAVVTPNLAGPTLMGLTVTDRRFRVGTPSPSRKRSRRVQKGTKVTYFLSEPAAVTFTFERRGEDGRGKLETVATVERRAISGVNHWDFSGRVPQGRLAPGAYRVTARAVDADGKRSSRRVVNFKIVP